VGCLSGNARFRSGSYKNSPRDDRRRNLEAVITTPPVASPISHSAISIPPRNRAVGAEADAWDQARPNIALPRAFSIPEELLDHARAGMLSASAVLLVMFPRL